MNARAVALLCAALGACGGGEFSGADASAGAAGVSGSSSGAAGRAGSSSGAAGHVGGAGAGGAGAGGAGAGGAGMAGASSGAAGASGATSPEGFPIDSKGGLLCLQNWRTNTACAALCLGNGDQDIEQACPNDLDCCAAGAPDGYPCLADPNKGTFCLSTTARAVDQAVIRCLCE